MKSNSPNTPAWIASALIAFGLGLSSHTATAQDFYAGIGIGQSKIDGIACDPEIMAELFDTSCNADDTDTAFKIFGGYKIPMASESAFSAAIELGYVDLGEASISGTDSFFGATRLSASVTGFGLSGVGAVRIADRLSVMGKIGVLRWDAEMKGSNSISSVSISDSDSGTDFAFGIGAVLSLTDRISTRIEWERFEIADEDVDLLSASLLFSF